MDVYPSSKGGLNQNIQVLLALILVIFLSPILLIISLLVKISSPGSILFKQKRMGLYGKLFTIYKFRTMKENTFGSDFTASNDERITKIGFYLRIYKLDELPQLWNILNKTMSFVGPRPEVPKYVNSDLSIWKDILSVRPGLTNPIMFEFINEQSFLKTIIKDREKFYEKFLLPYKLKIQLDYIKRRTWIYDLKIIFITILLILFPSLSKKPSIEKIKKTLSSINK